MSQFAYTSAKSSLSVMPLNRNTLQRKCACGGTPGPTGECAACRRKRLGIQPKLTINQPGDKYEQEADRVAEQVMRMPESRLHRQTEPDGVEEDELLQTKPLVQQPAMDQATTDTIPPIVHEVLHSPAQPLDLDTLGYMESRFGHDFSQVSIHADERASAAAQAVNARAFTLGRNIVFGAGQYAPGTQRGRRLLAHELTHVIQQAKTGHPFQNVIQRTVLDAQ